jgi:hypothetical protein
MVQEQTKNVWQWCHMRNIRRYGLYSLLLCLKFLTHLRTKTDGFWSVASVWSGAMEIVLKHISDISHEYGCLTVCYEGKSLRQTLLIPWKLRKQIHPKHCRSSTKLHDVRSQKTIFLDTAMWTKYHDAQNHPDEINQQLSETFKQGCDNDLGCIRNPTFI